MRVAKILLGAVALMLAGPHGLLNGQPSTASGVQIESLRTYLRDYLTMGGRVSLDPTTRITVVKENADSGRREEIIVYVSGQQWCGSGGCTLVMLEPTASTYKVLGRVTIVQLPVKLLPSVHYGLPDIAVTVQGGGIISGYEVVLSFNGRRYPGNPTMPPARKVTAERGKVIIANTEDSMPLCN